MELRLSCTNPSIWGWVKLFTSSIYQVGHFWYQDICRLGDVIMMVADFLAPNRPSHQQPEFWLDYDSAVTWAIMHGTDIMLQPLNHLSLDNMAAIFADDNFRCIFLDENDRIPIRISLKIVRKSLIDNIPALVYVMAWRWTGDKPLHEPTLTQFTEPHMWY